MWKQFKIKVLKEIEYFDETNVPFLDDDFYSEMQFYMVDKNYVKGAQIYDQGELCNAVIFIVQGKVDIEIQDEITG